MESNDHIQKIFGIGVGVSLQLTFSSFKKIITSHQGIVIRLSMEGTMIKFSSHFTKPHPLENLRSEAPYLGKLRLPKHGRALPMMGKMVTG